MSEINDTEELPEGNFSINLKLIKKHQHKYPSLMAKYKEGAYQIDSFRGVSNIYLNLMMYEDNIFIPSIIKSYVLHWYHIYFLHPGMDRTEEMIRPHLYWPDIRDAVQK